MMFSQITEITKIVNLPRVDELVKQAVKNYEAESFDIVFDCSKSLVECCCKTILKDLKVSFENDDDFQKILKKTIQNLSLLPESHKEEIHLRDSIAKAINGFNTIAQAIGELRNSQGIMAHGGDGSYVGLGKSYALLMISLSDAISTFLLGRHRSFSERIRVKEINFEDNEDFNTTLDEQFGSIKIYEVDYNASDVLHSLDPQGYEAYLTEHKNQEASHD